MTNSMKPVYLIGGRGARRGQPDAAFLAALRETGKPSPAVGYIGTANDDDARFLGFMKSEMAQAGAGSINHAVLTPRRADVKKAQEILAASDIIFVGGGDVERGMEVLAEKNMCDFILQLYRQGKPFFGVSAGSIMMAKEWVRWRDPDDDATAEIFPCLGVAPVLCDTHAEDDDWQEIKALLALEKDGTEGYGITSGSAIKVFPDAKVAALGGPVAHYVRRAGKVTQLPDLIPAES
jgi:cyanophycinase-like exopeptidase